MKIMSLAFVALLPLAAQDIKLSPSLDKLKEKATDVVDVNMDGALLQLAGRFLSDKDPDDAKVKKLVSGLKGVYVKSFTFDSKGEYQESDLADLRAQLKPPAWVRIVTVRSKKEGDNADVYLKMEGTQIGGLVVIVAEPKELTIVNIAGSINPEELAELSGHFGVPKLELGSRHKRSNDKEE